MGQSEGTTDEVVVAERLGKRYGSLTALSDCCLAVERGEIFGLLGPNGAGKSTLLRLIMGLLRPSNGRATVEGFDCYHQSREVHGRVAYLPGDARLPRHMTGRQVLDFFARLRQVRSTDRSLELAERLELDLRRRVAWMSTGMRQKLAVVVTLSAPASVMILDEPTANLDPTVRREVLTVIQQTRQRGATVVFSSHVLSEIEELCDRVAVLRQGSLVHTQCMKDLRRQHRVRARLEELPPGPPPPLAEQMELDYDPLTGQLTIEAYGDLGPLLGWLGTLGLTEVAIEPIGLKTVYERFHSDPALRPSAQPSRSTVEVG